MGIDEFITKAKSEIPEKIEEFVNMTQVGRIATDNGLFTRYIVVLPMVALLTLNVSLALLQVYVQVQVTGAEHSVEQPMQIVQRRLRGTVRERATANVDF